MRRLAAIAAFALFLAVPLWAQRGGGGHGGGGGHASFGGGGHAAISGGGHFSGGAHSASGYSHTPSRSSTGPYLHNGFGSAYRGNGFRGNIHTYGFRNNCYGYNCSYGWNRYGNYPWAWGYYDPYWWGDNDSYDNDNDYNQNLATADQMNQENLAEQQMFRQEQNDGDQDAYAPNGYGPRYSAPRSENSEIGVTAPATQPTVLVFRDQHKEEIENYAVVGQTLFNFTPQRTVKIPLADLDLAATQKANDDRGITFQLPAKNQSPSLQRPTDHVPASLGPASST